MIGIFEPWRKIYAELLCQCLVRNISNDKPDSFAIGCSLVQGKLRGVVAQINVSDAGHSQVAGRQVARCGLCCAPERIYGQAGNQEQRQNQPSGDTVQYHYPFLSFFFAQLIRHRIPCTNDLIPGQKACLPENTGTPWSLEDVRLLLAEDGSSFLPEAFGNFSLINELLEKFQSEVRRYSRILSCLF
jgi:hypothetical protein